VASASARERPALEVALPGNDAPGTWHGLGQPREVLFGDPADEDWRPVTVIAWWLDLGGRTVVQVEYRDGLSLRSGDFIVDRARVRDVQ
jgi:hypothetical protein